MSKFFVKTEQINNNDIVIIGDDVNHIINVLRMKKTDEVQICNQDTGDNYNAEIVNYSKNEVECKIISRINETTESNVHITLSNYRTFKLNSWYWSSEQINRTTGYYAQFTGEAAIAGNVSARDWRNLNFVRLARTF